MYAPIHHYFARVIKELRPRAGKKGGVGGGGGGGSTDAKVGDVELESFAKIFDFEQNAHLARLHSTVAGKQISLLAQLDLGETCQRIMQRSHADLISAFLEALDAMHGSTSKPGQGSGGGSGTPNLVAAHGELKKLCGTIINHFNSLMDLPISRAVTATFSVYRRAAEAVKARNGKVRPVDCQGGQIKAAAAVAATDRTTEECTMLLQKALGLSLNSRGDPLGNKRRCLVPLAAQLLRTYLSGGQYFLCDKLLRDISSTIDVRRDLPAFAASDAVEFAYYLGKFAVIRTRLQDARAHLTFASAACLRVPYQSKGMPAKRPRADVHNNGIDGKKIKGVLCAKDQNLRRILRLLVPVKMVLGEVPSEEFLEQHGLCEFKPVRSAVQNGQLGLLRKILSSTGGIGDIQGYQAQFAAWDILFTLEKLEVVAFRNLVRRVHATHVAIDTEKAKLDGATKTAPENYGTRLPLPDVEVAMRLAGCEAAECEEGQAACHLALLIEIGLVRGYIAQERQMLVLSAKNAFPPIQLQLLKLK
eukprot:INCI5603.1.p1 GENE.INCI5603.1~~INCI5603.1.p1  ORF type:complete len:531 (-),score=99.56 INCI5603.1:16-1608(-)